MRVVILAPRLDVRFKQELIQEVSEVPVVRSYWARFIESCAEFHRSRGDEVIIVERPLWQFSPEVVRLLKGDVTYVPHRMKLTFDCGDMRIKYYMQTVLPMYFWVDEIGFQSLTEHYPMQPAGNQDRTWMQRLQETIRGNQSKFPQPDSTDAEIPAEAIFFACQIPHDDSIRFHSDVGVEETLQALLDWAGERDVPVLVKGHPVNPASMEGCRQATENSRTGQWIGGNIHQLIRQTRATYIVNSGVGLEAMLNEQPVVCFGRTDYDNHVIRADLTFESLDAAWRQVTSTEADPTANYADFFDQWGPLLIDCRDAASFQAIKLPEPDEIQLSRRTYFSQNPDMNKPRIFIGSGEASLLERKTLMHSLAANASRDVDLYVFNGTHNAVEHAPDPPELAPLSLRIKYKNFTEFSMYRYLIPQLCNHQGRAIYLDSDMVSIGDISELFDCDMQGADFLATPHYGKEEWGTSAMLINCETCKFDLEEIFDEIEAGKYTYTDFSNMNPKYLEYHPLTIGNLDPNWNVFDKHDDDTKLIHYTNLTSQPWKFPGHPFGELWFEYFERARAAGEISEDDIEKQILRGYVRGDIREGNNPPSASEPTGGLFSRIFGG